MMMKIRQNCLGRGLAAVAASVFLGASAQAALLNVGGTLFPVPGEAEPSGGAVQLLTTGAVPFNAPGAFSGSITSTVYTNDATNPFGANAMTFVYEMSNNAGSANAIARLALSSFTGWQTDASFTGAGLAPTLVDRLTAGTVGWSFSQIGPGPLGPGQSTARLIVQTDAPAFAVNAAAIIDSGQVSGITALGPAIPEPASLGLVALSGLALRRRRR